MKLYLSYMCLPSATRCNSEVPNEVCISAGSDVYFLPSHSFVPHDISMILLVFVHPTGCQHSLGFPALVSKIMFCYRK